MKFKIFILITLNFLLVSCASYFKRKDCEATNWFEYGQKVAERGENLENDQFINECRKVEAEISEPKLDLGFKKGRELYCHPNGAFLTGKKGEVFSTTMCDGYNTKTLLAKYNAGLVEYCDESNGESAGASGQIYKNVCPKKMEATFLKTYKIGRKKYLQAEIMKKEDEVDALDRDIRKLEYERQEALEDARDAEARSTETERSTEFDARTGTYRQRVVKKENQQQKMEADQQRNEANSIGWQIQQKNNDLNQVKKQIRNLKAELLTL